MPFSSASGLFERVFLLLLNGRYVWENESSNSAVHVQYTVCLLPLRQLEIC